METHVNLDRKGIDLNSVRLKLSDEDLEIEEHVLVTLRNGGSDLKVCMNGGMEIHVNLDRRGIYLNSVI